MLKRRKDLPHRRMPVIILIIPLPSAEMSLSRYSLRSKYIISLKIFVSRHIFLQQKYTFYSITPNFFIDLTLQKHKKGARLLIPPKYNQDAFILLNSNFLHTTITILHDVQTLGRSRQSLTIQGIAREFLGVI